MDILNRIIQLLKEHNYSQKDLTDYLNIEKSAFSAWKSGKSKSYLKHITDIAEYLDTTVAYLFGDTNDPVDYEKTDEYQNASIDLLSKFDAKTIYEIQRATDEDVMIERYIRDSLTYPEIEHIKKYRTLDKYGKKAIDDLLCNEYKRCISSSDKKDPISIIRIKHSVYKASAGFGFDLEDRDEWDEIDIPDTPEAKEADFAVTIYGNSMEPIYHDNDIVLVKIQDRVNIGETGIFVVNGQGYIKQYGGDRLISVNSDYKDIVFTEGDFIKCAGKVIGIAG
jgi:phage repressor protein C with HTH and peptisase S24 domain